MKNNHPDRPFRLAACVATVAKKTSGSTGPTHEQQHRIQVREAFAAHHGILFVLHFNPRHRTDVVDVLVEVRNERLLAKAIDD